MFVIKQGGRYVAKPGRKSSYTTSISCAQKFNTYEEAKAQACGNEYVQQLTTPQQIGSGRHV